jgi:hypothetical protein
MSAGQLLETDETLRWEGRPAPRCFVFRNWRHALFGTVFLVVCLYWQLVGIDLAAEYQTPWLAFLPLPFVLIGLYLGPGQLVLARLEWGKVLYALSDRRLIVQRGLRGTTLRCLPVAELTYFRYQRQGDELGTLRVYRGDERLVLYCLEHPQALLALLEAEIAPRQESTGQSAP